MGWLVVVGAERLCLGIDYRHSDFHRWQRHRVVGASFCGAESLTTGHGPPCVMTVQEQYVAYLNGLSDQGTRLELKLAMLLRLRDREKDQNLPEKIPLLFTSIAEALHVDIILSLAKLFEERSGRNIPRFLNYVEANYTHIDWARQRITHDEITAQRKLIEPHTQAIQSIKGQRDKYFAHHDKEYFTDSSGLNDDFPLTKDAIINLVRLLQKILGEHSFALNGSMRVSIAEFATIHLDDMIRRLSGR